MNQGPIPVGTQERWECVCISAILKFFNNAGTPVNVSTPKTMRASLTSRRAIRSYFVAIVFTLAAQGLASKPAPHVPKGIVSDWTQRHILFSDANHESKLAHFRNDPRREQSWYLRHREAWWPESHHKPSAPAGASARDWSIPLGTATLPIIDFSFSIASQTAYGSINVTDEGNGSWLPPRQADRDRRKRRRHLHAHPRRTSDIDQSARKFPVRQRDHAFRESCARCRWTAFWIRRNGTQCLGKQHKQLFFLR